MIELIERFAQEAPVLTEVLLHFAPFVLIVAISTIARPITERLLEELGVWIVAFGLLFGRIKKALR